MIFIYIYATISLNISVFIAVTGLIFTLVTINIKNSSKLIYSFISSIVGALILLAMLLYVNPVLNEMAI